MPQNLQPIIEAIPKPIDLASLPWAYPNDWKFLLASQGSGASRSCRYSIVLRQTGSELISDDHLNDLFFEKLQKALDEVSCVATESTLPFVGGWFVYLGYEMAGQVESSLRLPAARNGLPVAYAVRCETAVIFDHANKQCWLVSESETLLEQAKAEIAHALEISKDPMSLACAKGMQWDVEVDDPSYFLDGVAQIKDYIAAGDVFQVNLSRQWRVKACGSVEPMWLYQRLIASNPAPFSGMAQLPGGTLISTSPERLVEVRDGKVQTRPIAGTRPRGESQADDAALINELKDNLKEQAEHVMLIDLERNDLGRVCLPGSVVVDELMAIESYAHVHHIVSNVTGTLKPDASITDVIQAVFPGGTITGCPKVRCMEIIAELEGVGRSFYTGAMGYIGRNRAMDMNILIRSVLLSGQSVEFRTGAGIVADSQPEAELGETEAKAKGLLRAFGVSH